MLTMIWAQGPNGELGLDNKLPWKGITEDLIHFRSEIDPKSILVMGYNTYKDIPKSIIKDHHCIVLSSKKYDERVKRVPQVTFVDSVDKAWQLSKGRSAAVIGGKQIYDSFMGIADILVVSTIDLPELKADTYAPTVTSDYKMYLTMKLSNRVTVHNYVKTT